MNINHLKHLQEVFPGRTALRVREICESCGIGPTLFYSLVKSGEIRVMKFGKATVVPLAELAAWMGRATVDGDECEAR
jgi:excisionase family DNA binding protein